MKKKMYVLGVAALIAALLAMSGVAQSAMWVGAELGGNFPLATDVKVSSGGDTGTLTGVGIRPSVIGGATIGYDFVNSGFGAYAWPSWMQYFSFAMDLTYNQLQIRGSQNVGWSAGGESGTLLLPDNFRLKGYEVAWTFLFMAHYGFLRDSEVPSGRINPYLGIGPAIVWTGFDFDDLHFDNGANGAANNGNGRAPGQSVKVNAMNVALVVEPGIRWVCFKNISIDTAMRYRYAAPSYNFSIVNTNSTNVSLSPLHQFSFLVRANYHF
jgi:hypothetical protein